jgi:hypothetical protein
LADQMLDTLFAPARWLSAWQRRCAGSRQRRAAQAESEAGAQAEMETSRVLLAAELPPRGRRKRGLSVDRGFVLAGVSMEKHRDVVVIVYNPSARIAPACRSSAATCTGA